MSTSNISVQPNAVRLDYIPNKELLADFQACPDTEEYYDLARMMMMELCNRNLKYSHGSYI